MKVVILCGGKGTRISEESLKIPKPLFEIGQRPIIWHIMKTYSYYGYNDFILLTGYKSELIKDYFLNLKFLQNDFEIDLSDNSITYLSKNFEKWRVKILFTGIETQTGGRLRYLSNYVDNNFLLTYGDGISDINISKSIKDHLKSKKLITMTCVKEPTRFGVVKLNKNKIVGFKEKDQSKTEYINGGFFVINKKILKLIKKDNCIFEKDILPKLVKKDEINAFVHNGFWYAMDTARDNIYLNSLWEKNKAQWKIWKN